MCCLTITTVDSHRQNQDQPSNTNFYLKRSSESPPWKNSVLFGSTCSAIASVPVSALLVPPWKLEVVSEDYKVGGD